MLKTWLCCVALCSSSLAVAQPLPPGVMPFPLEVKRTPPALTKEEREGLQREYTRLLRLSGAQIPDFTRYDFALKELKRQDCEREDECLVQLAKKAESLYALYVSLDYTLEGAVWVSGRVVRDDGKVARPTQVVKVKAITEAAPFKDDAMAALAQLFEQLKISELPAERPVEVKAPIVVAPVVTAPVVMQVAVQDSAESQRSLGRAVFIVGAVGAAAGGALLTVGQVVGGGLTPTTDQNLPLGQLGAYQSARTYTTAGFIGLAAGGATALVGAGVNDCGPVTGTDAAGREGRAAGSC